MLKIDNINVSYGQIRALQNVSLEVNENEIVALIGNNGEEYHPKVYRWIGLCKLWLHYLSGKRIDADENK